MFLLAITMLRTSEAMNDTIGICISQNANSVIEYGLSLPFANTQTC